MKRRPPRPPPLPYPTLFQSQRWQAKRPSRSRPSPPACSPPTSAARTSTSSSTSGGSARPRSEEHTSELQSRQYLVCRLLLEKKKTKINTHYNVLPTV